jgi:uncharacterized damage-inducible protein DinB
MTEMTELFEYDRWANRRMLEATGNLTANELNRDLGSSFPTVRATLAHILSSEWIWLRRWTGSSPTAIPEGWDLSTHASIVWHWREVEDEIAAFVAGLDQPRLEAPLRYRTTRGDEYTAPLRQLMRHMINHSTYHRGQITTMLRQLGSPAPSTDLVLFYRGRAG